MCARGHMRPVQVLKRGSQIQHDTRLEGVESRLKALEAEVQCLRCNSVAEYLTTQVSDVDYKLQEVCILLPTALVGCVRARVRVCTRAHVCVLSVLHYTCVGY
jgi:hypothetical protein